MATDLRQIIRDGLAAREWTVPRLARECIRAGHDVCHDTIYRYLAGRTQIGADTLEVILGVLGITMSDHREQS
ncbi:MAG TPA: hypothetical protein ENN81_10205 [Phycisphaerales bacterium]|nr:hypothetical protein [Phycisphaerales bacterium]